MNGSTEAHRPCLDVQPGTVQSETPEISSNAHSITLDVSEFGSSGSSSSFMPRFNAHAFLHSTGVARRIVEYRSGETIFSQGDACRHVMYIHKGGVKLSVRSSARRQAVVAMLGPADFFGEGCLAGQTVRVGTATAIAPTTILLVDKPRMVRLLHQERSMSDRFITYILARNLRIEEDLIDQLSNSSEKRLARALLLMAGDGQDEKPQRAVPRIAQNTLADMVGTTRSRVNFFLNKFKKLGLIKYTGGSELTINSSLLLGVLQQ